MSNQTEWVQVGELAEGFAPGANTLEYVEDLAGKTLVLHMENGWVIRHVFNSGDQLSWEMLTDGKGEGQNIEDYTATSIRPGIYFVDFIKKSERATSVSLVLDFINNTGIAILAELPTETETMRPVFQRVMDGSLLTGVDCHFYRFVINAPYDTTKVCEETDELIGKRVQYTYSPHESYEHVYLNTNYYSWQCLQGVEKGLADTDKCHYYKIDEKLYLFCWREKIIPTLGVIMIDLERLKTTGKIVGYQGSNFSELNNFPVGAFAKVLNETVHSFAE